MHEGSIWRKWDLHIHTPGSFHHNFKFFDGDDAERYEKDIWMKYIDELEKVSDVSVIGITDYFSIEGYKRILKARNEGRLQNFDLILPNIEFRLDKFVGRKRLNYHIIFSEEIDVGKIDREFLEDLHIKTPAGEDRKLSKENIEYIGKTLKEQHSSFVGRSDYIVGCENITVSLDEIIEVLNKKGSIFNGKYLLVLVEDGWSSISWDGQDHLTRKEILARSHAIFSSNPNTRSWALGKKDGTPETYISEFNSIKPCIHGSDAHDFNSLCKPEEKRFCWIKANPSFEGLRQIMYEPDDRVKIQSENPENRKNIYTLRTIKIQNSKISDELSIREQDIPLNRNLVAVTGGKGNGKTALLDFIANCFEDRCKRSGEDKNSFIQRIEDQKKDLKITLKFIGDYVEDFSKEIIEYNLFRDSKITYLPQGKIGEYSGNRKKLNDKIEEIIFNNNEIIEGGFKQRYDDLRHEILQLVKEIDDTNIEIYKLEEDTKDEIMSEIENKKQIKRGELSNKEEELKELIGAVEADISERINGLKEEESTLRIKHSTLETIKSKIEKLEHDMNTDFDLYNITINELNADLTNLSVGLKIPSLDTKPQIDEIKKILEIISADISDAKSRIEDKKDALNRLSGVEKEQAEILKDIDIIKSEISLLYGRLDELMAKRDRITLLETQREENYLILINKYYELSDYYKEIIGKFSKGKSKIMSGINFESGIYFDMNEFVELGSDIMDLRKINTKDIEKYANRLESIIAKDSREDLARIYLKLIEELRNKREFLKGKRTNYDFYKWIWGDYFSLDTTILFKGTSMDKLSMGQKGTVLLKLFLAEGDYPLILDQPEENLDNKFIYDELVEAFKEGKRKRQIVIATNNANLIVNTDAEQIIVAEFKDNEISYKLGALENLDLRKDIMPILEGGIEAFRKREMKYGI